jgi:transposase-like protein
VRTDEDTLGLVRRLAQHHDVATIAGILNKQERTTARGLRFTQHLVGNLRRHWNIPRYVAASAEVTSAGELMSVRQAARELDLAPSTIHRWINDGFIAGEQLTPGAPWRLRVSDALKHRLVQEVPEGYVVMQEATRRLGVSRQTVLHRVQRGELDAVLICRGRQKGLRIRVLDDQPTLFDEAS